MLRMLMQRYASFAEGNEGRAKTLGGKAASSDCAWYSIHMKRCSILLWFWLFALPAGAADTWTEPFPGIQHLHRTGPAQLNVHAAVVDLCAPGVSVRHTAFEERQQRTSTFAVQVGAQLAINGDFSCRPIDVGPNSPFPPCIGRPVYGTYGIAAHAGQPWPDTIYLDALLGFGHGRVQMYDNDENQTFNRDWMSEVISGHGSIVRDGQLTIHDCPINPRTAIGLSRDHTQVMVAVADGRNGWRGMTCLEIGALLIELGADRAFALDGGGSSTFWLEGPGVVNHPSDGVERIVGPHLAFFASGSGAAPYCERPFSMHEQVPLPHIESVGPTLGYIPVTPERLFDTRHPSLSSGLSGLVRAPDQKVAAQSTTSFDDLGDALGVVVNVTAVDPNDSGFVVAWPGDLPQPDVSTLNFQAHQTVANLVGLPLGPSQKLSFYTYAETHLIADLQGYFQASGAGFVPEAPRRLVDTRATTRIPAGETRQVVAPNPAVAAMALQVTTVSPAAWGFVTLFPCGQPVPNASHLNHQQDENRAASVIAKMGPTGICAYSYAETDLLVDVHGTFQNESTLRFQPVRPVRLMDTRQPNLRWRGRIEPDEAVRLPFRSLSGVSADAAAVWVNLTAVSPVANGFVSLTPCASAVETSVLNFREERNTAANVVMGLDAEGSLCLQSSVRTHMLVDLFGYFAPAPTFEMSDAGPTATPGGDAAAFPSDGSSGGTWEGGSETNDAGFLADASAQGVADAAAEAGADAARAPPGPADGGGGPSLVDAAGHYTEGGGDQFNDAGDSISNGCACSDASASPSIYLVFLVLMVWLRHRFGRRAAKSSPRP